MNEHDFIFWLQGFLERRNSLTATEINIIQEKIKTIRNELPFSPYIFKPSPSFGPLPTVDCMGTSVASGELKL